MLPSKQWRIADCLKAPEGELYPQHRWNCALPFPFPARIFGGISMNLTNIARLVLAAAASLSLAACGINSVPAAEEEAKAKWADVEAQFQHVALGDKFLEFL